MVVLLAGEVPCHASPHSVCDEEGSGTVQFDADVAFTPREELLDRVHDRAALSSDLGALALPGGRSFDSRRADESLAIRLVAAPQILAVLEGSGEVSGASGVDEPIDAGEAVFWREGEEHELKTTGGLTALIIEGRDLDRFRGSG